MFLLLLRIASSSIIKGKGLVSGGSCITRLSGSSIRCNFQYFQVCSLIKSFDQFESDGCENCESVLHLKHNRYISCNIVYS